MRKYRVLEVREKKLTSRLTAPVLEGLLNRESRAGWDFERAISGETFFLGRDTLMLVFSQPVSSVEEIPASALALPGDEKKSDLDIY